MLKQEFVIRESGTLLYRCADQTWSDNIASAQIFANADAALRFCVEQELTGFQIIQVGNPHPVIELEKAGSDSVIKYGGKAYFFKATKRNGNKPPSP